MITHYYMPRLPHIIEGENHNKARKRRMRDLLKLAEHKQPIFAESPVFPFDPNDWKGEKAARDAAWACANTMSKIASVPMTVIEREIAQDALDAKRLGKRTRNAKIAPAI